MMIDEMNSGEKAAPAGLHAIIGRAHETLDELHHVLRIGHRALQRDFADHIIGRIDVDDRRRRRLAFGVFQHHWLAVFIDGGDRAVCSS